MIKKTIICFLLLFIAYTVYREIIKPEMIISQDQWQDNQIRAQQFLYSDTLTAKAIVVGSSLTTRLIMDSLDGFTSLSFGGESSFEGLRVISTKKYFPKYIFIEINTLFYNRSGGFDDILYNPILYTARKYFPVLRDGKQPLPLLENHFERYVAYNFIPFQFTAFNTSKNENNKKTKNPEVNLAIDKMLEEQKKGNHEMIPQEQSIIALARLKSYTDLLEANGTEIIFLEMPLASNQQYAPMASHIRSLVETAYPTNTYKYIYTDWSKYETTDGLHLGPENALKYTIYLKEKIQELTK